MEYLVTMTTHVPDGTPAHPETDPATGVWGPDQGRDRRRRRGRRHL